MSPIRIEIAKNVYINDETFTVGEQRVKTLGGSEGIRIDRLNTEPEIEVYSVSQIDTNDPYADQGLQNIIVALDQPSGHFFIGDTEIFAKYIKKKR